MKLNDFRLSLAAMGGWLLLCPQAAQAQPVETVGARALGMAGAFVAVADDAAAIYWNPAGLSTGSFFSLVAEHGAWEVVPRGGLDTGAMSGSGTLVALGVPPFGLGYYRIRISAVRSPEAPISSRREPDELDRPVVTSLVTHNAAATVVQTLAEGVTVAASVRYVRGLATAATLAAGTDKEGLLDEVTNFVGRADNSLDVDVGAMASVGRLRLGIVARNLRQPEFEAASGVRIGLDRQVRAGVAVTPNQDLIVALDVDMTRTDAVTGERRNVAIGAEQWWGARRIGARAGIRANTLGDARPVIAGGVSVAARSSIWIEGQVTGGARDADRGWSLGARFGF